MKRVLIIALVFVSILLISGINSCVQQPEIYKSTCTNENTNKSLTLSQAIEIAKNSECNQGLFDSYSEIKKVRLGIGPGLFDASTSNVSDYVICDSGAWWLRLKDFKPDCKGTLCLVDVNSEKAAIDTSCILK